MKNATQSYLCRPCKGSGKISKDICPACHGTGYTQSESAPAQAGGHDATPRVGSDTPETDQAEALPIGFWSCATVTGEFARRLERERDRLKMEIEQLRKDLELERMRLDWLLPRQSNMHQTRHSIDKELSR